MCITTLIVGSLLLTVQMVLKQAAGPAVCAVLVMVPTFMFQKEMKTRFLRSFEDAALLQTSLLDGWDNSLDYSFEKRQEFRQFLVDAHKAAYVSRLFSVLSVYVRPNKFPQFHLSMLLDADSNLFGRNRHGRVFDRRACCRR